MVSNFQPFLCEGENVGNYEYWYFQSVDFTLSIIFLEVVKDTCGKLQTYDHLNLASVKSLASFVRGYTVEAIFNEEKTQCKC